MGNRIRPKGATPKFKRDQRERDQYPIWLTASRYASLRLLKEHGDPWKLDEPTPETPFQGHMTGHRISGK
jgi:hypothetical protein